MDQDFGLLVDFLRGELDEGSAAEVRQRLEHEPALFEQFERLRRTYAVLRSMPVLRPAEGHADPGETPAADIPLTEPREEFVRDVRREFGARGLASLVPFIEADPRFVKALQVEFFVRGVVSAMPMIGVTDSLLAALRNEFSARARVRSLPFIAAQPAWIKALREEFMVRATVGSIPMLEVRPEFAAALREEFTQRALVSSVPALDATDGFRRRLKVALVEAGRDTAPATTGADSKGGDKLPVVDASDPFRRRVFKQILLNSRRKVRETPTRVDISEYEWGREIKRGWKKSRRPVAFTMALHAIAIGVLLFVFTNRQDLISQPTIAAGQIEQIVKPPEPALGDGDYDADEREPVGPRYIGLGDWNSRNEDLPVGLGGDPVPESREVSTTEQTPPDPDRTGGREGTLEDSIREDVASFFRLRADPREKKIDYLGSAELYSALDRALAYLQRMQQQDGYWGHVDVDPRFHGQDDLLLIKHLEITSVAVLAFLGDGHSSVDSPLDYDWNVRRGIDWILEQQHESGQIGPVARGNVLVHAMATLALAEDFGMTRSHKLREPLRKACRWLCDVQAKDSDGFPFLIGQDASMTVSVWAYMALATARNVRVPPIDLPRKRIDAFLAWYSKQGKRTSEMTDVRPVLAQSDLLPVAGAAALNLFAEEAAIRAGEEFEGARRTYVREVNRAFPDLNSGTGVDNGDMRYLFFGSLTQALTLQREGRNSNEWYRRFTTTLLENQQGDGAYKPGSEYGSLYGDAYAAAMAALSIENAYRVSILKD